MKKLVLFLSLFCFVGGFAVPVFCASKKAPVPVAVLYGVKGSVKYTKNGKKWKKVRRNKFLFAGYQIKTGPKGSGMITYQKTGKNLSLQPNSLIAVTKEGLSAKAGVLAEAEQSNKLLTGLMKRFNKSQSYTTVRRSAPSKVKSMEAALNIVLSKDYPYMVWENYNPKYRYVLTMGESVYQVPPSENEIVKVKVSPFDGQLEYFISAFDGGKEVLKLKSKKRSRGIKYYADFLNEEKNAELQQTISNIKQALREDNPGFSFMLGRVFVDAEMWVPAMDYYNKYLADNPDDIDMTPHLLSVYKKLKFKNLYKEKFTAYQKNMRE